MHAAAATAAPFRHVAGGAAATGSEFEVLVVGGGAAGLTAAYFAALQGARVCSALPHTVQHRQQPLADSGMFRLLHYVDISYDN